jgi:predicted nuclease with TOPRIM domain
LRLRPVAFRYRQPAADGSKPIQYGLIAEEVAEVYPDLVVRGKDGQVDTVQYWKLDAMLLNELQKLAKANAADQERIGELLAKAEKLQSQVAEQQKQIASRARASDSEQGDVAQLRAEFNRLAAAVAANERLSVSAIATAPVTANGDVVSSEGRW